MYIEVMMRWDIVRRLDLVGDWGHGAEVDDDNAGIGLVGMVAQAFAAKSDVTSVLFSNLNTIYLPPQRFLDGGQDLSLLVVRVEALASDNAQAGLADGRRISDELAESGQGLLDIKTY